MANPFQVTAAIVTGTSGSRSYAVGVATAAGDTLTAVAVVNNTTGTVSALADSQGNTWVLDRSFTTTQPMVYAFRCQNAAKALAITDTFTLTTAAVSANIELYVTDAGATGALDQVTAIATGTGTTPSVSATPATNNETAVSMWGTANGGGAPTVNSPFTGLGSFSTGSNPYSTGAYDVLAGGSGVALTSTLTIVSANWRGLMWLFAPGSGGTTVALPVAQLTVAAPAPAPVAGPLALAVAQITIAAPAPTPQIAAGVALPVAQVTITAHPPTPAVAGALIVSLAAKAGTDSYGNTFPEGLGVWQGIIQGATFQGTDFILNSSGAYFYSGTPAAGNLIASITRANGTDGFGNTVWGGIAVYTSAGQVAQLFNGQLLTFAPTVGSGSGSQGDLYSNAATVGGNAGGATLLFSGAKSTNTPAEVVFGDSACGGGTPVAAFVNAWILAQQFIFAANPTTGAKETWHTFSLQNGFTAGTDINGTNYPPAYMLLPDGRVALRGELVTPSTGTVTGVTFATVPAAYSSTTNIPTATITTNTGNQTGVVYIRPNGNVQLAGGFGNSAQIHLDCTINVQGT